MNSFDNSITQQQQQGLFGSKAHPREIFQIIEKIGEGAYGSVYKAVNKITDQIVAIKICSLNSDEQVYKNEIHFLKKIDHPFIVKLLEFYETEDEIWLILEYCQLGSITDIIKITKQPFNESEIACVCSNILQALDYIHTIDKIHRDIKPGNILINHLGQIKLTDFGIASTKSFTNSFIGSPLWMAPEQLAKKTYDNKIDIWALGITIIEMAEGKAPYDHLHPARAMFAIQHKPQTQFAHPENFSPELNDFLSLCLQVEPKHRPPTTQLMTHAFVQKYKGDFPKIRKNFYCDKLRLIEDHRKYRLLSEKSQQKHLNNHTKFLGEIDHNNADYPLSDIESLTRTEKQIKDQSIHSKNLSEISISIISDQDNLTFVEKSLMESISQDTNQLPSNSKRLDITPTNHFNKLNMALALNYFKSEQKPLSFNKDPLTHINPEYSSSNSNSSSSMSTIQTPSISRIHSNMTLNKESNREYDILVDLQITQQIKRPETLKESRLPGLEFSMIGKERLINDDNCNNNKVDERLRHGSERLIHGNEKYCMSLVEKNMWNKDIRKIKDDGKLELLLNMKKEGNKVMNRKTYKKINESNFVVKVGRKYEDDTKSSENFDGESTLNPISFDRFKLEKHEDKEDNIDTNKILNETDKINNYIGELATNTSLHHGNNTSNGININLIDDTLSPKVLNNQYPSVKDNPLLFKIIKENLDFCRTSMNNTYSKGHQQNHNINTKDLNSHLNNTSMNISDKKLKLERQMKSEINEIKQKYSLLMKNLEKPIMH